MSDESSSSTAAAPGPTIVDGEDIDNVILDAARLMELRKKSRDSFNRMRVHLLGDLIQNLDILVFAELSVVYYMDCHIIRFLLRGIVQYMFLTPKPAHFPRPPKPEPYIGAIVGTNLLCLILHIFSQAPAAGEATRFYLHGSLIIDFIGQRGPTSKLLLIILDLMILALQLVHLSAHITRKKMYDELKSSRRTPIVPVQDIDSEERGVRRSDEVAREQLQEGIELQSLGRSSRRTRRRESEGGPAPDAVLFDSVKNGQIVLADLNIWKTVKELVIAFHKTPVEARRSALRAHLTGRLTGLRVLGRGVGR